MKKTLVILAVLVVLGGGAFYFFKLRNGGPEGVEVEVEPVARMTVVETVDATGRIQPKTQVNISADVSAKITRLEVDEGDWVDKGALLLQLDRASYLAAVESAQAVLSSQLSNVDVAAENRTRPPRTTSAPGRCSISSSRPRPSWTPPTPPPRPRRPSTRRRWTG